MYQATSVGKMILVLAVCAACCGQNLKDDGIKPYSENPRYWQYQGKPVFLLGASDDDCVVTGKAVEIEGHTLLPLRIVA